MEQQYMQVNIKAKIKILFSHIICTLNLEDIKK